MPEVPKGEKRPADVIANAAKVMKIATGEMEEDIAALCLTLPQGAFSDHGALENRSRRPWSCTAIVNAGSSPETAEMPPFRLPYAPLKPRATPAA